MQPTEALHQMPVVPLLPSARVGGSLASWLRQRDFIVRVLAGGLLLSLLLNLTQSVQSTVVAKKRTVVVVLDRTGNGFRGEGASLDEARELHEDIAQDATVALLARGPDGFRYAARLPRLFSRGTQGLAQQLRLNEEADFTQRQLRQTPEIARLEVRTSRWSGVEVVVTGQLFRAGHLAGQPVAESVPFTLKLNFTSNPDLLKTARYPLIVTAFTLTYESPHP